MIAGSGQSSVFRCPLSRLLRDGEKEREDTNDAPKETDKQKAKSQPQKNEGKAEKCSQKQQKNTKKATHRHKSICLV